MVEGLFCANCGAHHLPGTRFCQECGASLTPEGPAALPDGPPAAPPPPPGPPGPVVPAAGPGVAAAPAGRGGARTALWAAIAVLATILVVVGIVLVRRGGHDEAAGEVFLEPATFVPEDPFTESVDLHNGQGAAAASTTTAPVIPTTAPAATAAAVPTRAAVGALPGLYGGTRDRATCDGDKLVAFLEANPAKARAWAGVLGVAPADIRAFVGSLTPVILQRDTRVTNHGFRNGVATPTQAVLQAGTAVFVDRYGVPRVKCNCGNPLAEPRAIPSGVRYGGSRWPTFAPANVIRVTTSVRVSVFILVDVAGGEPFSRPPGSTGDRDTGVDSDSLCDLYPADASCAPPPTTTTTVAGEPTLGTGDVQVTLRWSSKADLDLAVNDPGGGQIDYQNRTSSSGGTLDVDSNHDCATASGAGVENVYWPTGKAPEGVYRLTVTYYDVCDGSPMSQPFELTFLANGTVAAVTPASVQRTGDGVIATYEVQVGAASASPLGSAGGATRRAITGTVQAGQSTSYTAEKGPGFQATSSTTTTPDVTEPGSTDPGASSTTVPEPTCEELYPGPADASNPMRVLCEHQP